MSLIQLGMTNYRCFAGEVDLDLRPITVVLGRNNSGKSALVRAPLVLGSGINTDSPAPLDLDEIPDDIVGTFTDLIYGGRPHGQVGFSFTLEGSAPGSTGGRIVMAATIRNVSEFRTQVVEHFTMHGPAGTTELTWQPSDLATQRPLFTAPGWAEAREVHFSGVLPRLDTSDDPDGLSLRARTISAYPKLRYVGPFRDRPARVYRVPGRMPASLGRAGENTAAILASDFIHGDSAILREINDDLREILPDWSVDILDGGTVASVVLRSRTDEPVVVNLVDTGAGVGQILPLFVQRALDRVRPPDGPVLEIVEQPELHLHPYGHAALADLYLQEAKRGAVRFLIETHSETFLLRLRVRVAERAADPEEIAIYFVDNIDGASTVRRIRLDSDGNLDYWPEGVFSEDYRETKALAKAQLDRVDSGAR